MVTVKGLLGDPGRTVTMLGDDSWSSVYYGHCRDIIIAGFFAVPLLILITAAVLIDKMRGSATNG